MLHKGLEKYVLKPCGKQQHKQFSLNVAFAKSIKGIIKQHVLAKQMTTSSGDIIWDGLEFKSVPAHSLGLEQEW
jgi:hypothetical protein